MTVIDIARKYLGTKEQFGNKFREDLDKTNDSTEFAALIHKAGQKDGESWCCYTAEVFFCLAFPQKEKELIKLFSANCFQTYINFLQAGYQVVDYPVEGALVLYMNVKDGVQSTKGHAGVCTKAVSRTAFWAVEGNTNDGGGREGEVIAEKTGRSTLRKETGLNVLGFVKIS